jgi:protein-disulfide isomerase
VLGRAGAPATLIVFEDPQCPFCREFSLGTLPRVVARFVRTGRLGLAYRGIEIIGPDSELALRAIYAAGKQNRLWNMAEALYRRQGAENSGWITKGVIREAAIAAGANPGLVLAAAPSAVTAELRAAALEARAAKVAGTPGFLIERPGGVATGLAVTSLEPRAFSAALAAALQ